jgi:hypothetical protein
MQIAAATKSPASPGSFGTWWGGLRLGSCHVLPRIAVNARSAGHHARDSGRGSVNSAANRIMECSGRNTSFVTPAILIAGAMAASSMIRHPPGNGIFRAETKRRKPASRRQGQDKRLISNGQSPPIRHYSPVSRKLLERSDWVVDLRGFELRARHPVISNPSLRHANC